MEKKYQVFVSSTYKDLIEERKKVIQTLLELDCIPVGMELFPASDDDQWSFIQSVIDDCDYYILILAGRYGSCSEQGIGYTEMEYQYALETNKPIIAFLYENPDELPVNKTDDNAELKKKLLDFRALTQKKLCKYWKTPNELGGVVATSLLQLKKRSPAIGWVKADLVPDESATKEILRLKNEIDTLKQELEKSKLTSGIDISTLSQGEDGFIVKCRVSFYCGFTSTNEDYEITLSWNTIFSILSPSLIDEASNFSLRGKINSYLVEQMKPKIVCEYGENVSHFNCYISTSSFDTIIVQLRALNLIEKSEKNRSVKDKETYWKLTHHGDDVMVGLRAIKNS